MNSCNFVGRLVKDPEPKTTQGGIALLTFTIAVPRNDKDRNTDFISCQAWRSTAEFISRYFHKGDPIEIQGKLQGRSYEDSNGNKKFVQEIVVENVGFVPQRSGGNSSAPTQQEEIGF